MSEQGKYWLIFGGVVVVGAAIAYDQLQRERQSPLSWRFWTGGGPKKARNPKSMPMDPHNY
jgi:hypothetical protein